MSLTGEVELVPPPPADAGTEGTPGGRYAFLVQRATAFVRERGGAVPEDVLVTHVFGAGSPPSLWRPLLRQVLSGAGELALRADGCWAVEGAASGPAGQVLAEFVALDVETTGLRPLQQRVIELAVIRYRDGLEVERFETLLQPEKRIPKYIADLTGITDLHVTDAPRFAEVAERVIDFIGSALVVGHNVGFDLSFLNAELKRLGRPQLVNERLDVMTLAPKLLSDLRRPGLDQVALAVGLNPRHIHRAGADAQLAGEVAFCLAERAKEAGYGTLDLLKELATPTRKRPHDTVGRGRAVLDRSLLADVPKRPGVYVMRDAFDKVIYVGKAKNLRDRVASYFSQPLGYTRKMDGLLESMVRIETEVTGSEIEALLLESQLIRRYQPRYNTALRASEHYPFIRVDVANPWPRVTLAKDRRNDGARYFGPFRSKGAARTAVELINANVPLRTCPRSFKDARSYGAPCIQLDIGRCLGPCVGRADRDEYVALVREVVQFLSGDSDVLYERIWRGLEEAADRLDYERARRLRNDLQRLRDVSLSERRMREAAEQHSLLLVLPSAAAGTREVLLVVGGRLWARLRADRVAGVASLAERLAASWERMLAHGIPPLDQDSVDEANILNRWLFQMGDHPAVIGLDPDAVPPWQELAGRVLALADEELVFETRRPAEELDAEVGGEDGERVMDGGERSARAKAGGVSDAVQMRGGNLPLRHQSRAPR